MAYYPVRRVVLVPGEFDATLAKRTRVAAPFSVIGESFLNPFDYIGSRNTESGSKLKDRC